MLRLDAGYNSVYGYQVGPDQEGLFRFWRDELQPALAGAGSREPIAVG